MAISDITGASPTLIEYDSLCDSGKLHSNGTAPQLTPPGPQAHEVKFVGFPQTLTQFLAGEALQNILEHRFAAAKVNSEMVRLVKIDAW